MIDRLEAKWAVLAAIVVLGGGLCLLVASAGRPNQALHTTTTPSPQPPSEGDTQANPRVEAEPRSAEELSHASAKPENRSSESGVDQWLTLKGPLEVVMQRLGLATPMQNALIALRIDPNMGAHTAMPHGVGQRLQVTTADGSRFMFSGEPLYLSCFIRACLEEVPGHLTKKDAIRPEEAKHKAKTLLDALGIDEDMSAAEASYLDPLTSGCRDDLVAAFWHVTIPRTYRGFLTDSYVAVSVSAYSGDVKAFSNRPFVEPETVDVRLSVNQASAIVDSFAAARGLCLTNSRQAQLAIVHPNCFWDGHDNQQAGPPTSQRPRLVYRVSVRSEQESSPPGTRPPTMGFYVDAATGQIVGGFRR